VVGNGLAYSSVGSVATGADRLTLFAALGDAPTPGTVVITLSGAANKCAWSIVEYGNTSRTEDVVQSATAAGATVTLGTFRDARNATAAGFAEANGSALTPEAGHTSTGSSNDGVGISILSEFLATPDTTPSASGGADFGIAVELQIGDWLTSSAAGGFGTLPLPLRVGDHITAVDVQGRHVGASGTFSAALVRTDKITGSRSVVASVTSTSGSTADQEVSMAGLDETVAADTAYHIEWSATAVEDQRCYGASVTFDHPGEAGSGSVGGDPGPPGPPGADGATGAAGPMGPALVFVAEGQDGDPGPPGVRGADGAAGAAGATGPAGPPVFLVAEAGADGEPGPPGPAGVTGATGAAGPAGPAIFLAAADPDEPMIIPGPAGPAGAPGGGGGSATVGTTTVDFGAFPGSNFAFNFILEPAILAGSIVQAWLYPVATADHSDDEHLTERIRVMPGPIVPGVAFYVNAYFDGESEPTPAPTKVAGPGTGINQPRPNNGGKHTSVYGLWTVAWSWQ